MSRVIEMAGDKPYEEAVTFTMFDDGSLRIWMDAGDWGDSDSGYWGGEAERTFSAGEVSKLKEFLEQAA